MVKERMHFKTTLFLFFILSLSMMACKKPGKNIDQVPAKTEKGYNMVVEIPAGTNHKFEFNKTSGKFEVDQVDGKDRIIDFLHYPGNYGFIPSTFLDPERGGDRDALDILLISESLETGSVVEVKPIAALMLKDRGEIDTKIIAIPVDSFRQVMAVRDFQHFLIEYDAAKKILEDWFLNYKGFGKTEFIGWKDDVYAIREINKWIIQ